MYFIDTHAHIYSKDMDMDIDAIIASAIENNVQKIIMPNIDLKTIEPMNAVARQYPENCFAAMGLHPCSVKRNWKEVLAEMKHQLSLKKYVAIGETGLDYYWDKTFKEEQELALIEQINWANDMELPIILHTRNAFEATYEIIKKHKSEKLRGVFHCFGESNEAAKKVFDIGFYIGIGGVVTFKNAGLDKTLESLDLDKVILETDSPYLAPKPFRGKKNRPSYIKYISEKVSELKSISLTELAKLTSANAHNLFNI